MYLLNKGPIKEKEKKEKSNNKRHLNPQPLVHEASGLPLCYKEMQLFRQALRFEVKSNLKKQALHFKLDWAAVGP